MSTFIKRPIVELVDEINTKNPMDESTGKPAANFLPTELVFKEISFDALTGKRTVEVHAAKGSPYYGMVSNPDLTYNRRKFETYFTGMTPFVEISGADTPTVAKALAAFYTAYNMPEFDIQNAEDTTQWAFDFTPADLAAPIDLADVAYKDVVITPDTSSVGWYGKFTLRVYNKDHNLNLIITDPNLDGLLYPDDTAGLKTSMQVLSAPLTWSISSAEETALGTKGKVLDAKTDAGLINTLADTIVEYYSLDAGKKAELVTALTGATVKTALVVGADGVGVNGELTITETDNFKGILIINAAKTTIVA